MGYFSQWFAGVDHEDVSYLSAENQLQMRLADLKHRLEELTFRGQAIRSPWVLTEDDLRYVLPEHLYSVRHVKKAIELAELDLRNDFGVMSEEPEDESLYFVFVPNELYSLASVA